MKIRITLENNKLICIECNELYHFSTLTKHLKKKHNLSVKEYYDKHFKNKYEGICLSCGEKTKFLSIIHGYLKYCKKGCNSKNLEDQNKRKQTNLKKYGIDNIFRNKNKIKQSYLKKYGVENPSQLKEIKEKKRKTCFKKYGVENWSQTRQAKIQYKIARIKQIENQINNNEPAAPNIGTVERECLNELQKFTSYIIIRNDPSFRYIVGRFPDGHIPELKLFIQFDEKFHFLNNECTIYKENDNNCTLELASLGYIIFRISEKNWKENKEKTIKDFILLCQQLNYLLMNQKNILLTI